MTYHCKLCDNKSRYEIKDKPFKSNCHKFFDQFTIARYIVENPNIINLSEKKNKYVDIHSKKYSFFHIISVLKVDDNQYIRHRPLTNLDFGYKTVEIRCNFLQILELRITFASCRRFMTYNYYIKQPMPMCETKLNQLLHKKPELINCLNRFITYPFIKEYAHIPYSEKYLSQCDIIKPF